MFVMRLLDRMSLLTLFIVAFAALAVLLYAYWIVDITPNDVLNWSMLGLTGVCVAVMVVLAVATRDTVTRWLSPGLIGVVGSRVLRADYRQYWNPHSAVRSCPNDHILLHADSAYAILSEHRQAVANARANVPGCCRAGLGAARSRQRSSTWSLCRILRAA